jgi:hypothetical protein
MNVPPATSLAISAHTNEYRLLTDIEADRCSNQLHDVCPVTTPTYALWRSRSCLIAWFLKDPAKMDQYCRKSLITNDWSAALRVTEIGANKFLVFTREDTIFRILCDPDIENSFDSVTCAAGNTVLKIPGGCVAKTEDITIYGSRRPHVRETTFSQLDLHRFNIPELINFNVSELQWAESEQYSLPKLILENKAEIPDWIQDSFRDIIAEIDAFGMFPLDGVPWTSILIYTTVGILVVAVLVLGLIVYCKLGPANAFPWGILGKKKAPVDSGRGKTVEIPLQDIIAGVLPTVIPSAPAGLHTVQKVYPKVPEPTQPKESQEGDPKMFPNWISHKTQDTKL